MKYIYDILRYKLKLDICLTDLYPISENQGYFLTFDHSKCQFLNISTLIVSSNNLSYNIAAKLTDGLYHIYTTIGNLTAKDDAAPFEGSR